MHGSTNPEDPSNSFEHLEYEINIFQEHEIAISENLEYGITIFQQNMTFNVGNMGSMSIKNGIDFSIFESLNL